MSADDTRGEEEGRRAGEIGILLAGLPSRAENGAAAAGVSYATRLDDAIATFTDPLTPDDILTLIQLHAARLVVDAHTRAYTDTNLETLAAMGILGTGELADAMRAIAAALAIAGRFTGALAAARGIEDAEERAWALRAVAAVLVQAGEIDEALAVAEGIEDAPIRAWVLRGVAWSMAQAGAPGAEAVFGEALAVARGIEDASERAWALAEVAAAMAQAGEIDEALAVARGIEDAVKRVQALRMVAEALANIGQYKQAFNALGECGVEEYIHMLAGWAQFLEQTEPGLSVAALREATRIAGWVWPGWQRIHAILAAA
jgi:tetratricopeptide (TPR) repeat protein